MGKNFQTEFENSATFGQFHSKLVKSERKFKGVGWNLEVTAKTCNELITGFVSQQKYMNFRDYFRIHLDAKFKKSACRLNFVLALFFSLLGHSKKSFEIQIYRKLFNSKIKSPVFEYWLKIRKNVCVAKDIKFTTDFLLEDIYLVRSESDVIAKKSDCLDLEEFKDWASSTEKKIRESRKLKEKSALLERKNNQIRLSEVQRKIAQYTQDLHFVLEEDDEFSAEKQNESQYGHASSSLKDITIDITNMMNIEQEILANDAIDEKHTGFMMVRKVGEINCGLVCWKLMKEKFRQEFEEEKVNRQKDFERR